MPDEDRGGNLAGRWAAASDDGHSLAPPSWETVPFPVQPPASGRVPLELGLNIALARTWLWRAVAAIVVLDLLASIGSAAGAPYTITRFFDGDYKVNFPTGYKIFFLLLATLLFALVARAAHREGDGFAPGWRLLAWVAGFACVDETVYLHQSISEVLHNSLHTDGVLKFAWTLVYAPAAAAIFVILLRYLKFLAPSLRWSLLLGGALYGGGAVLLEPVKSHFSDVAGENSLAFKLVAACSDSSEMIGLTVLVVVLLTELARRADLLAVCFSSASPRRR